jgi:O-antigen/teichoic acid export membrane protein
LETLRSKAVKGISWNGIQAVLGQVASLVIGIILARLLPPETFGLVAMIFAFTSIIGALQHFGLANSIVQSKEVNEERLSSVFWFNVGTGFFLWFLFLILAYPIAVFYQKPLLKPLIYVSSLDFIVSSFTIIPNAILQKNLEFKKLAFANVLAIIIPGVLSILLAIMGFGVWSLVLRSIIASVLSAGIFFYQLKWRPQFRFNFPEIKGLLKFGLNDTANSLLFSFTNQIDSLLVGKQLGSELLGIYNKAFAFLMFPIQQIRGQILNVIFPIFSLLQDEGSKIKQGSLTIFSVMGLLLFPMMLGLYAVTEEFVLVVLGKEWLAMIPMMKIFCITALFEGIKISGVIILAVGRTDSLFKLSLFTKPITIALIVIGLKWGLNGLAIGVSFGSVINFFVETYIAGKYINLSLLDIFKEILPVLLMSLIMLVFIIVVDTYILRYSINTGLRMLIKIFCGIGIFILQLLIFKPKPYLFFLAISQKKTNLISQY